MNKFWEWMKKKEYGGLEFKKRPFISYHHNESQSSSTKPTKQMLIGYMIEYLSEKAEYRGLWRSFMVKDNGELEEGWSVTFNYKNELVETDYQKNMNAALEKAIEIINKDK